MGNALHFLGEGSFTVWVSYINCLPIKLRFGTAFMMVISHSGGLLIHDGAILERNHKLHAPIADNIAIYNLDLVFARVAGFEYGGAVGGLYHCACPIKLFI